MAPFPYPYRSAFSFRADLDESVPEDYHRFAAARATSVGLQHSFRQHVRLHPSPLGLRRPEAPRHPVARAFPPRLSRAGGESAESRAGPPDPLQLGNRAGRICRPARPLAQSLDEQLEDLGYLYSSDFQIGYDDFPFYPWQGDRFSRVLQIPVHPVCEGLFLEAGVNDPELIGDYFRQVVRARLDAGELAVIYGHPERRLGRMPEIMTRDRQRRSIAGRWSGGRLFPSLRAGGGGGPSADGWSFLAITIAWKFSSTNGTPSIRSPSRSSAAASSARCP